MSSLYSVFDARFRRYGAVLDGYDISAMCEAAKSLPLPDGGVCYERLLPELEATSAFNMLCRRFGGEHPIQAGLCWGSNDRMNAVEYHRSSEVNIAVTDLVLMLGDRRDVESNRYDSGKLEFFHLPAGTVVELYATTLHFAPCNAAGCDHFYAVVVLPQGTNAPLSAQAKELSAAAGGEDRLLFAQDKWMIAHAECGDAINDTAFVGITGENRIYRP